MRTKKYSKKCCELRKLLLEWCHQDGDIGHSWLCSPSQEELISIQVQDNTKGILEHRGAAETPLIPQRPRQTGLEG